MPDETESAVQPWEGSCNYYEVARKLAISGSQRLVSEMIEVRGANVVEVDVQDFSSAVTAVRVGVQLQYGNDGVNWTEVTLTPLMFFQAPGSKAGVVTNVSARFVRLSFQDNGRTTQLAAGIRLRTEPPRVTRGLEKILPGLEPSLPGVVHDYLLLADRLSVAQASSAFLAPVSMRDFNTVQLDITVFATTSGLPIGVDVQASNDAQTWETIRSFNGIGVGASAPAAIPDVSFRFVRVKVNGPQALGPAELALGMKLSKG